MKKKFYGFYDAAREDIEKCWQTGIIAFDANTLLNSYRYTENTRKEFLNVLNNLKDRIWLPYQAAYEYQKNRIKVIKQQELAYEEIQKIIDEQIKNFENKINEYKRHPYINVSDIKLKFENNIKKLNSDLDELKKSHPSIEKNDSILLEITELFNNKVGDEFSDKVLEKIYEEGLIRYEKKIPPGYHDKKGKNNGNNNELYGDLIIWKELINQVKYNKKQIIFVTDDRKEDWWRKNNGKTIGPRPELIKEFFDETGIRILIYQADIFLKYAKEKLKSKIEEQTIEEIKTIRLHDEDNYHSSFSFFSEDHLKDKFYIETNRENLLHSINSQLIMPDSSLIIRSNPDPLGIPYSTKPISLYSSLEEPGIKSVCESNNPTISHTPAIENNWAVLGNSKENESDDLKKNEEKN